MKVIKYKKNNCFILLQAFNQFFGHDHIILMNEYLKNFDAIMPKYGI